MWLIPNHAKERRDGGAGYMYGEAVASLGWRACFFIEAAFGFPVALLFLFAPAIDLRGEGTELPGAPRRSGGKPGIVAAWLL